jgi:hypothetical protein
MSQYTIEGIMISEAEPSPSIPAVNIILKLSKSLFKKTFRNNAKV